MDADGYPEAHELQTIREWQSDYPALVAYVRERWYYAEYGWRIHPDVNQEWVAVSPCGWSGNESLIEALEANRTFWFCCWQSSRRGGHFEFRVRGET